MKNGTKIACHFLSVLATLLASLLSVGCATAPEPYAQHYQAALNDSDVRATVAGEEGLEHFTALYGDLQGPDLRQRVEQAYAPDLYFNDTVHTFHERQSLVTYLQETATRAEAIEVDIEQVIHDDVDTFVRWQMRTVFRIAGRDRDVKTIGISHLRFDDQGRVILHQDFWDSTEGLYRHIPLVGSLVNWVRGKL